ncbi:MAG: LysR family transcriptional regulator [Phascolarctobacterium sp.]|nr:LysR family transcriptional regulator [Phascolarctobacterium sp.]
MQIQQIKYFLAIVKYGSMNKATKQLFVSQPALSKQIHLLEEEIGMPLFIRDGKRLILTEAGNTLLEYSNQIDSIINSASSRLTDLRHGYRHTLSIGICKRSSIEFLPFWIREFIEQEPNIRFKIYNEDIDTLIHMLNNRDIDLIFTRNLPRSNNNMDQNNIMEMRKDQILALIPECDPLANKTVISLKDFNTKDLILRINLEKNIMERCHKIESYPRIRCLCNDVMTTLLLVSQNVGIGLIPESCSSMMGSLPVVTKEIEELNVYKKCYAIYKDKSSGISKEFLKLIIKNQEIDTIL